ncbi:MAG: DUF1566 domain-containing protein [Bacteroidaceae bacterium]
MNQFKFPDTGQKICYDLSGKVIYPQPVDLEFLEDGCRQINPLQYRKYNSSHRALDPSVSWLDGHRMTEDLNTGLMWAIQTEKTNELTYYNNVYTWADAKEVFINQLNINNYCGYNDWRLPNKDELRSIVDYSQSEPAVQFAYFPNVKSDFYWTSLTYQMQSVFGWAIYMGLGSATAISKKSKRHVMAVRGGFDKRFGVMDESRFVDNGDGTVTDSVTNLMWQQGDNERMNFVDAMAHCKKMNLAGYKDWKLPNIKELNTILNLDRVDGWWYFKKFFPVNNLVPPLLHYFSCTTYERIYAWVTNFNYGYDGYYANKMTKLLFRAVRTIDTKFEAGEFKMPESGQDICYNTQGETIEKPTKDSSLYGQDGSFKINPFAFEIKVIQDQPIVFDHNTGLYWERKSCQPDAFNYMNRRFTYGEAKAYIAFLNTIAYLGFADWRMPNVQELRTLATYADQIPAADMITFPDTQNSFYWSNQAYETSPSMYWGIYFGYGCAICNEKDIPFCVRAVRGGYDRRFGLADPSTFVDNNDGTVTDVVTGLMWKQDESGILGFEDALTYCKNLRLGGYNDWRMPNQRELGSLLNINHIDGTWYHKQLFPNVITSPLGFYWSSTTFASTFGFGVNFQFGYDGYYADKINGKYPLRPVRNIK